MTTYSNTAPLATNLTWSSATEVPLLTGYSYSPPSDPIDNTPTNAQSLSYLKGLLRLSFSVPQTSYDTTAPHLTLLLLPLLDGANTANPPGATGTVPPTMLRNAALDVNIPLSGGFYQIVDFGDLGRGFALGPFKYAFQLRNGTSRMWTGSVTATLYRWNIQNA